MEIEIRKSIAILIIGLATLSVCAHAASFQAQVPFNFVVGNQTLPAGTYTVQRLLGKILDSTGVVVIQSSDRRIYRAVITRQKADGAADQQKISKLLFATFKGKQYLTRICVAGDKLTDQLTTPSGVPSREALPVREIKLVSLR